MIREILGLALGLIALYWSYREARAEGSWSLKLILGFFVALGVFGAGYLWPMMNSEWLNAHPDSFGWVIFGPGALLVAGFYFIVTRVQKAQQARKEEEPQ